MDDWDLDLLSFWLMGISAIAALLALFFYARDPRCLWRKQPSAEWTGKGFEPGIVANRLAQVRKDYVSARHPRPQAHFHAALLERAASMVRSCGYWRQVTEHADEEAARQPKP